MARPRAFSARAAQWLPLSAAESGANKPSVSDDRRLTYGEVAFHRAIYGRDKRSLIGRAIIRAVDDDHRPLRRVTNGC